MQFIKRVFFGLGIFFVLMVAAGFVAGVLGAAVGEEARSAAIVIGAIVALGAGIWYIVKPRKAAAPTAL